MLALWITIATFTVRTYSRAKYPNRVNRYPDSCMNLCKAMPSVGRGIENDEYDGALTCTVPVLQLYSTVQYVDFQ